MNSTAVGASTNAPPPLLGLFRRLWQSLARRRRWQLVLVLVMTLLSALAEVISIGAVIPFLGVLFAPDRIFGSRIAIQIARIAGITSPSEMIRPLTVAFMLAVLTTGLIRITLLWVTSRVTNAIGNDISVDMYRRTLYQPYQVHCARNSSLVVAGLTHMVNSTIGIVQTAISLVSSGVLVIAITAALLVINAPIALTAAAGFGICYGVIVWLTRKRLEESAQLIARESTHSVQVVQEGLGAIRDVLLDGTQELYCGVYSRSDYALRRANGRTAFIGGSPRPAMETLGTILITGLAYMLHERTAWSQTAVPLLGALALGAQRLLPALHGVYGSWTGIASGHVALRRVMDLLEQPMPAEALIPSTEPLPFQREIRFEAVSFSYDSEFDYILNATLAQSSPIVLDKIDLTLKKGCRIGFVGSTGSGKSTMLDLLMGLLEPMSGAITVDGVALIGERVRAWRKNIAHVPQSIYLSDASFLENIAFGVPPEKVDRRRVQLAAQQARIADFIESRPRGYEASIGERGVRLSGGQRQRIGLARALYKQAPVLVLDEATSALDNATESEVMAAIGGLSRDLTVVIVAHRLTTVRRCDVIVELLNGRVAGQGTYEELMANSISFQNLVNAS